MAVITLCGSTKFKNQFEKANAFLTLQGNIVISVAFLNKAMVLKLQKNKQIY